MVYQFDDIYNENIITTSSVLFITGKYPTFNRLVADRIRDYCKGEQQDIDISSFGDFFTETRTDDIERLSLEDFMLYCNTVRVTGLWYCSVDYGTLTKKEKDAVKAYIKAPGQYGKLVVYAREYKDILEVSKIPSTKTSKQINLIKLSYPRRGVLIKVVTELFAEKGVEVTETAANLFILRLGISYDKYSEHIARISNGIKHIDYDAMQAEMKGVTSYVLDDLIKALLKPAKTDKVTKNKKAYKILNTLIDEMGAQKVLRLLSYQIDNMLELRHYINTGVIPVLVPYSVEKAKKHMNEKSRLRKMTDITFKRNAQTASMTSTKDWLYMKLIIKRAMQYRTEESAMKGLLALVNRTVFPNERLVNDLGVKNILTEGLYDLNRTEVFYNGSDETDSQINRPRSDSSVNT